MGTIFRRFKSSCWQCQYKSAEGKWLRVTTHLRDRAAAKIWCDALQEAQEAIGGNASEVQLREIIAKTRERISGKRLTTPSVRGWFGQWIAGKIGSNAPGTITRYQQSIGDFLAHLGKKADGRLESIDIRDILDFRNHMLGQGKTPTTINLTISKIVAAPFSLAFRQGVIRFNPVAELPRLKEPGRRRKQPFTIGQVRALVAVADGDWKGAIIGGYTTGMRLSDLVNLQWKNIDLDAGVVHFTQRKTQSADDPETILGLHPDFRSWLQEQLSRDGMIFPTLAGRPTSGARGLSTEFSAIMAKAGIESENIRSRQGKGRTVRALTFHSLRHTAASKVFTSKVVEESVKAQTGHGRGSSHRTYLHVDLPALQAATASIPRL